MSEQAKKMQSDHELITFELSRLDKYVVLWVIIGTILMIAALDWLTTFEGVWIWGMPRSAFGIVLVGGIANLVLTAILYPSYQRYFERKANEMKDKRRC